MLNALQFHGGEIIQYVGLHSSLRPNEAALNTNPHACSLAVHAAQNSTNIRRLFLNRPFLVRCTSDLRSSKVTKC